MNNRIRLLTVAAAIAGAGSVWAGELGHYGPGIMNIGRHLGSAETNR